MEDVVGFGVLMFVVILLAAVAISRNKQERHEGTAKGEPLEDPLRPQHDHPWAFFLLAASLLANVALGYLFYDLRKDLDASEQRVNDAVEAGEARIRSEIESAIARIPDVTAIESSVAEQERVNERQERILGQLVSQTSSDPQIQASSIETPFFCSGELAVWDAFRGLSC